MKRLLNVKACPRKAYFASQGMESEKGKGYDLTIIMQELLTGDSYGVVWLSETSLKNITDEIRQLVNPNLMTFSKEVNLEIEILAKTIKQCVNFLAVSGYSLAGNNVQSKLKVLTQVDGESHEAKLSCKFLNVFKRNDGSILVCNYKRGTSSLTNTKRTGSKNLTSVSMELYLMYLLGKQIYPNEKVIPGIIALTSTGVKKLLKFDTAGIDDRPFSAKSNIFEFDFENEVEAREVMELELIKLLAIDCGRNSEKKKGDDCAICPYSTICQFTKSAAELVALSSKQEMFGETPKFTSAQKEFMTFYEGTARVLATAGSGKTTCMVSRIVNLLIEGSEPGDFEIITFTDKGREELAKKLSKALALEGMTHDIKLFDISTFNSFGGRIIEENYEKLGYTDNPRLLKKVEGLDILVDMMDKVPVMKEFNYRNPMLEMFRAKGAVQELKSVISKIRERNIQTVEDFEITFGAKYREYNQDILDIARNYNEALMRLNLIDYSDQLWKAMTLLSDPEIAGKYQYKHIIVDEYQDTSRAQLELCKLISTRAVSFVVCGDDAQAIFGFRGVGVENILNFMDDFPDAHDFRLLDNFRSTQQICAYADKIIAENEKNINKPMIAHKSGPAVNVIEVTTKDRSIQQPEICVNEIARLIANGERFFDIAMLAKTKRDLYIAADLLSKASIPFVIAMGEQLKDNQYVLAMTGLANFLLSPINGLSLAEWIQAADYKIFNELTNIGDYVSLQRALISEEIEVMDGKQRAEYFFNQIKRIDKFDDCIKQVRLMLISEECTTIESIALFLNKLSSYSSDLVAESDGTQYDAVTLSTMHSAKGREFKNVVLSNFEPKRVIEYDAMGSCEEIRVKFVGVTRAMDYLAVVEKPIITPPEKPEKED